MYGGSGASLGIVRATKGLIAASTAPATTIATAVATTVAGTGGFAAAKTVGIPGGTALTAAKVGAAIGTRAALAVDVAAMAADFRDPDLAQRAAAWRATVEAALALRLGSGTKGKEAAALLFAAWQGQALWSATGDSAFRLKDAVKRLT